MSKWSVRNNGVYVFRLKVRVAERLVRLAVWLMRVPPTKGQLMSRMDIVCEEARSFRPVFHARVRST